MSHAPGCLPPQSRRACFSDPGWCSCTSNFFWRIYSYHSHYGHIHFTFFDKKKIFWNLEVAHVGEGALLNHGHCVVEVSATLVLFPIIRISVKSFLFWCRYYVYHDLRPRSQTWGWGRGNGSAHQRRRRLRRPPSPSGRQAWRSPSRACILPCGMSISANHNAVCKIDNVRASLTKRILELTMLVNGEQWKSNEPAWIGLCAADCSEVATERPIVIVLVFLGLPGEVLSIHHQY